MKKANFSWDGVIRSLILIKLGQDLGTYCPLTKTLHDVIEIVVKVF